jgi:hypothetical protein
VKSFFGRGDRNGAKRSDRQVAKFAKKIRRKKLLRDLPAFAVNRRCY